MLTVGGRWVDCSSNNPLPDMRAYAAEHTHIARKVSEGYGYHWLAGDGVADAAHGLGLTVSHYHWLRPDTPAISQAAYFTAALAGHHQPGDRVMIDFEATYGAPDPSDATRANQLRNFAVYVAGQLPGYPIDVYTGNWYLAGKPACQAEVRRYGVVMSDYSHTPALNPYGLNYVAQQFTDKAVVAGFSSPVDYNTWLIGDSTQSLPATPLPAAPAAPTMKGHEMDRLNLIQVNGRIYITDRITIQYIAGPAELAVRQADLRAHGGDPKVYHLQSLVGYGKLVA